MGAARRLKITNLAQPDKSAVTATLALPAYDFWIRADCDNMRRELPSNREQ